MNEGHYFFFFLLLLFFFFAYNVLYFLEITLMESDTFSDDLVETQTFDLSDLVQDKVYQKTFKFRQVFQSLIIHLFEGTHGLVV